MYVYNYRAVPHISVFKYPNKTIHLLLFLVLNTLIKSVLNTIFILVLNTFKILNTMNYKK